MSGTRKLTPPVSLWDPARWRWARALLRAPTRPAQSEPRAAAPDPFEVPCGKFSRRAETDPPASAHTDRSGSPATQLVASTAGKSRQRPSPQLTACHQLSAALAELRCKYTPQPIVRLLSVDHPAASGPRPSPQRLAQPAWDGRAERPRAAQQGAACPHCSSAVSHRRCPPEASMPGRRWRLQSSCPHQPTRLTHRSCPSGP